LLVASQLPAQRERPHDPAAWGGDHVGKPLPEYVTGDECLFCHRSPIGTDWPKNHHYLALRKADADAPALADLKKMATLRPMAGEVEHLIGGKHFARFLKADKDYGKLDLLSVGWKPGGGLAATEKVHWDAKTFADQCAGCHATAVAAKTRAFASPSLDCFVCHGDTPLEHSKDTALAYLSRKRRDSAAVVTSICAQCHVRTGQSRSSGLPYPNQFVAGDNLFRDFQVDFSEPQLARLNPADRHILENVRDVVQLGTERVTCLTCHDVHKESTRKHHRLAEDASCRTCHEPNQPKTVRKVYEVHSERCGY
jgi:hypothetical protein